jgi:DNA-binding NarL/FixJ family response regulator
MVLESLLELRSGGTDVDALTSRESQVLGMLRRGQTTAAMADRLQITPVTVRRRVSEIVRTLRAADRSELMARDGGACDAQRSASLRADEPQSIPSLTA